MYTLDQVVKMFKERPPELPLLAIRAGRRAAAANPDDANAYLRLGQAYVSMQRLTLEGSRAPSPLVMLRHAQAAGAFRRAILLNPDSVDAHQLLAALLLEFNCWDAALDHRRRELELTVKGALLPGETPEAFNKRCQQLDAAVHGLEDAVQQRQNLFVIRSEELGDNPRAKAALARELNLGGQALDGVLMKSRVESFGSLGAREELELLIVLGRSNEARAMLDDADMKKNKFKLLSYPLPYPGAGNATYLIPAHEWLSACAAAADGDYDAADAALNNAIDLLQAQHDKSVKQLRWNLLTFATEVGLGTDPASSPVRFQLSRIREDSTEPMPPPSFVESEISDMFALRGVLALERGRPAEAEADFREALTRGRPSDGAEGGCPSRALAQAYLNAIEAVRNSNK
jgi:tetratricopeptide (TPR) repeat protein